MDNCILSNNKILPFWYLKIYSYFPDYKVHNNFYNNKNYFMYKFIFPNIGVYSLKNIYDIFKIHKNLNKNNIIAIKYLFDKLIIYKFIDDEFIIINIIKNNNIENIEFKNLINEIFDDNLKINDIMFLGILIELSNNFFLTSDLKKKIK